MVRAGVSVAKLNTVVYFNASSSHPWYFICHPTRSIKIASNHKGMPGWSYISYLGSTIRIKRFDTDIPGEKVKLIRTSVFSSDHLWKSCKGHAILQISYFKGIVFLLYTHSITFPSLANTRVDIMTQLWYMIPIQITRFEIFQIIQNASMQVIRMHGSNETCGLFDTYKCVCK